MGETENKNTAVKESWFAGLKAEFKKIITLLDTIIQYGVNFLVNL